MADFRPYNLEKNKKFVAPKESNREGRTGSQERRNDTRVKPSLLPELKASANGADFKDELVSDLLPTLQVVSSSVDVSNQ